MKECVENLQCRTARGPQQETDRIFTPACYATADSEWLVAIRVCSDIQKRDIVVMVHGDFVSTADMEESRWLESMPKNSKSRQTPLDTMEKARSKSRC